MFKQNKQYTLDGYLTEMSKKCVVIVITFVVFVSFCSVWSAKRGGEDVKCTTTFSVQNAKQKDTFHP